MIQFTKMHGCGNDYIYINCLEKNLDFPEILAKKVSDRHFGVGADGLVLIEPSICADVRMRIFNADGSEAQMCGNASRCVAKYVYDYGIICKKKLHLETRSGVKEIQILDEYGKMKAATVDMGAPIFLPEEIPAKFPGACVCAEPLLLSNGETRIVTCVSMGNPHCVCFVEDINSLELEKIGPFMECHERFPERINTEFVRVLDETTLEMRVWERGSGETLACGTGACAAVVAAILNNFCKKDVDILVKLRGGDLVIHWDSARNTVTKTGPAAFVCRGELLLD